MKNVLRLFAVLLALVAGSQLRAADDDAAARRTQAEALLQAMHTDHVLTNATGRVHQMVTQYSQQSAATQTNLTPEQNDVIKHSRDEANAIVDNQLGWDAVKGEFIQLYADAFTVDELKGLVAFYSSPLGQTLVEKQPAVTQKMGELTQQKMKAAMPLIMQKIKDGLLKPATSASPGPTGGSPTPPAKVPAASTPPTATASPAH